MRCSDFDSILSEDISRAQCLFRGEIFNILKYSASPSCQLLILRNFPNPLPHVVVDARPMSLYLSRVFSLFHCLPALTDRPLKLWGCYCGKRFQPRPINTLTGPIFKAQAQNPKAATTFYYQQHLLNTNQDSTIPT